MEIKDFPDYKVYDDGRIESCKFGKSKFLKLIITKQGYHYVNLYKNGKVDPKRVHRLVAEAYIPNPLNKPEVDHRDRNPGNNHVSNLRWATHSENKSNTGMIKTNTSGHKYICYKKRNKRWIYQYIPLKITKTFKSKIDAICYKYIMILKHKLHKNNDF